MTKTPIFGATSGVVKFAFVTLCWVGLLPLMAFLLYWYFLVLTTWVWWLRDVVMR
jgi:hypothetical protein